MKTKLITLLALHLGLAAALAQPVITCQPTNQTAIAGSNVTFTVCATGAPPLSYQWRSHANQNSYTNIPFGTQATLVLTNIQPISRRFGVVVTDGSGLSATSTPLAQLTVVSAPSISVQPASRFPQVGDPVAISVTATGTPPLSYQWLFNGQNLSGQTRSNLTWNSVQTSNAGPYSVVITNNYGSITSQVAILTFVPPIFTKIINDPAVRDGGSSFSCAWGDFDNDGYEDLFIANSSGENNFLYHNNGNASFTRITSGRIVNEGGDCHSAAWGDYDNDGYLDLFVTSRNGTPPFFYRNMGNGSFARITNGAIATNVMSGFGVSWGDFDNDGFIDLFVARYDMAQNNFAYKNNGDGTFSQLTSGSLVEGAGGVEAGCTWGDYDNDGRLDLFVTKCDFNNSSHGGNDLLYRNNGGGGVFVQITGVDPVIDDRHDVGCIWGDYDNDGFLDMFVSCGGPQFQEKNLLYHNKADGSFERVTLGSMTTNNGYHTGCAWGDYDNDGFLDLFVARANGQNNLLYHNNGDGTFTPVTNGSLVNDGGNSFGCTWADYDNDGFLDLYVCNGGTSPPENNFLYRNNGNSNAWIKVKCVGGPSNRAAIGVKVRVRATLGGKTFWQLREISGGGSQGSQGSLIAHFGLGNATNVNTVRIEWPSGTVQELHNVTPKQILTITEPPRLRATGLQPDGSLQLILTGASGLRYDLETSSNLVAWTPWQNVTNSSRSIGITDPDATNFTHRFYRAVGP